MQLQAGPAIHGAESVTIAGMSARSAVHGALALVFLLSAPVAFADPAGKSTTEETIRPAAGAASCSSSARAGEDHGVRRHPSARPSSGRASDRRSLAFFAQLTDPQIADEMSPARVDFLDAAGNEVSSSWRPMEAIGLQVFDQIVRNVNANRRSEIRGRGARAQLGFAVTTGDLADNQQLNETRWFKGVLDGGRVDPFSGQPISATNPCGGADQATIDRLNADVAARRYTGVADYDDYPGVPADRYNGFWDPDVAPPGGGPYAAFPRYPGFLERAQAPFAAEGLKVPWYISRGNHDGLIQGNAPASTDLFRAIAVGCLKVFPSAAVDPARFANASESEVFAQIADPSFIQTLLAGARMVPPDPDRKIISTVEYKREIGDSHGYGQVAAAERRASDGVAAYYSFRPRAGIEMVSLDTVAEGGGQNGNLDDSQYKWLERTLRNAERARRLVIVYGHHTLGTMSNTRTDEQAGSCKPAEDGLRRRPAPLDAAAPRAGRREERARPVPEVPERDRLRRRPHARQPRRPVPQGPERVLADQHRVAHRLAAAEPAGRGDGQPRRHAVAVRDDPRPRGPDHAARRGHGRRRVPPRGADEHRPRPGLERPAAPGRPVRRPTSAAAAARTATWSWC